MMDLMSAVQKAVFIALNGAITPPLASVFDTVPENTAPPFVKVGAIDSENAGGKRDQVEKLTVEIISVYRGPSRAQLLAIMAAVRTALDSVALAAPGVAMMPPAFVGASISDSAADGVTYAAVTNFEIFAEPA